MAFISDENLAPQPPAGQILIYQDGGLNLQVRLDGQTVWLTQAGMADLFQTTPQNITMHLATIYEDGELDEVATCKEFLQVQPKPKSTRKKGVITMLRAVEAIVEPDGTIRTLEPLQVEQATRAS